MRNLKQPILAIVIPCYNEEEVLSETIKRLKNLYIELLDNRTINEESFIIFVDDGSIDNTWSIIKQTSQIYSFIKGIKLSKNEGHQNALLAGMQHVSSLCDCMVSMDADLQQDPNAVKEMLNAYTEGYEIVLGIREDRESDSFFKKFSAEKYYKLMQMMGVEIEFNHADYRLMSKKSLYFFLQFKERNLFIRGMVKLVGLKTKKIYFKSSERFAGESKYPLKKMLSFALAGITSFSVFPLKLITISGIIIFIITMILGLDALYTVLFTEEAIPGWASTVLPIYFLGGVELLALGILGEYIGRIYTETKNRPLYFIEEEI
jgi:glycosyltransferase involved in cell wall biosynthesis